MHALLEEQASLVQRLKSSLQRSQFKSHWRPFAACHSPFISLQLFY